MTKLVEFGSLTEEVVSYLRHAVCEKKNILISGGTGTGKTSLLGALSGLISEQERLIVIEDTHEIKIEKPHVVYLETQSADERGRGSVTIRDLFRATLRLRPDRIVVGEVRGREALDMIQAMTSGHSGSLTTVHADSPLDAARRIETMALMADMGLPLDALRNQIVSAIDLVVQAERLANGIRRVREIAKMCSLFENDYTMEKIFVRKCGSLCSSGTWKEQEP